MAKVTYHAAELVWISILGEKVDPNPYRAREDDGLIHRFLVWLRDQDFSSVHVGGMSGGGCYLGAFYPEDAVKVQAWLKKQGVRKRSRLEPPKSQ